LISIFANVVYALCIAIIVVGLLGAVTRRNLVKIVIALDVLETGINLFIVSLGYRTDGTAPIFTGLTAQMGMVDPIPQALTLTSIVIGACVIALALTVAVKTFRHAGTLNSEQVAEKAGVKG